VVYLSGDPMKVGISRDVSVVETLNLLAGGDEGFPTKWSVYVYISVITFKTSLPHLISVQFAHTETLQVATLSLSLASNARNPVILQCSSGIDVSTGWGESVPDGTKQGQLCRM
jgi:hypothetical protein